MPDQFPPTGRPTELEGTDVLNVTALVAGGLGVKVPVAQVRGEPLWALLPLIEGAHSPGAQEIDQEGRRVRRLNVTTSFTDDTTPAELLEQARVQETDDGFRQRRWLVWHYVDVWNSVAEKLNTFGPEDRERVLSHCRAHLEHDRGQAARLETARLRVVYIGEADGAKNDRMPDLYARQVAVLAIIKAAEAGRDNGIAELMDPDLIAAAARNDARGLRPLGILNALAYDACSPLSVSAAWGRTTDDGKGVRGDLTTKRFYAWASEVTGYNEQYVRDALEGVFAQVKRPDRPSQGKRGSIYPDVVRVLRARGEHFLKTDPARRLWAQSTEGTALGSLVGPYPVARPGRRKPAQDAC